MSEGVDDLMTEPPRPGFITDLGVCTPLGLAAPAVEAAMRAGIFPAAETSTLGPGGDLLPAVHLQLLPAELGRVGRILRLAELALEDLAQAAEPNGGPAPTVFMALPPAAPDLDDALLDRMGDTVDAGLSGGFQGMYVYRQGRSAFFYALHACLTALAAGKCEAAVVGAADSWCAPATLVRLAADQRHLASSTLEGIIPGEGAAFLHVLRADREAPGDRPPRAALLATATAAEPRHFHQAEPCQGEGLTAVFRALREHPWGQGKRADLLYTCETGEHFWAEELSHASLRNPALMPEPFVRTTAAEAFGDLGAASGAVMLAMGVLALARRPGGELPPLLLMCGSSDDGHLGGCLVQGLRP